MVFILRLAVDPQSGTLPVVPPITMDVNRSGSLGFLKVKTALVGNTLTELKVSLLEDRRR